jgi:hypothetical protein
MVDLGAPLADAAMVGNGEAYDDLVGYSILEGISRDAMMELLQGLPALPHPGGPRQRCTRCCRCPAPSVVHPLELLRRPSSLTDLPRLLESRYAPHWLRARDLLGARRRFWSGRESTRGFSALWEHWWCPLPVVAIVVGLATGWLVARSQTT